MIPSENESTQHRPTAQHDFESELLHKTQHTDFVLLSPNNSYPRQNITKKSCWVHQTGPGTPQSVESAVLLSNLRNVSQTRRRNVVLVPGATKQKRTVWTKAEPRGGDCCCFFFFFYNNEKGARRKGCFSSPARRTRHSRQQRRTDGRTACGPGQKKNEPSERGRHQLSPLPFCPKKKVRIGCPNRNGRPFLSFPFFSFFFFRCVVFSFPSPTFLLLSSYGPTHFLSLGGSQLAPTRRSGSLPFACKFTNCIWQNG